MLDHTSRARASAAVAAAVGLALGVGQLSAPVSSAALTSSPGGSPARPSVTWRGCGHGFQCSRVRAPLDYDQPFGAHVSISVIRLPAEHASRRIGSLLVNPGGPGGSGVDFVRAVGKAFPQQLRERFDIVGFDPRGVIGSTPLHCFRTLDQAFATLPPFAFPVTSRQEDVQRTADRRLARACSRHGGRILAHMSTADVARDMDLLRASLGDRRLSYLGYSYGSFLGETYANLFPDRIRALVIDGVIDPVAWTTGSPGQRSLPFSTRLRSDQGARATLRQFFLLCDRAGALCAFSGHARQRYAALAHRLRHRPLVVHDPSGDVRITYADLVSGTLGAMYSPVEWPDLARALDALSDQAGVRAAHALARVRADLAGTTGRRDYPNYVESGPGVFCSDSVNPTSFGAWRRAADSSERRFGYFARPWTWVSSSCLPWPKRAGQDRYLGPWTARTSAPVLVVGNRFDPATRYHSAVEVSHLLPRSRLLTYAGWGHTAFLSQGNACVDRSVTAYLVGRRLPPTGAVCRPAGSPFGKRSAPATATRAVLGAALPPPAAGRGDIPSPAGSW